MSDDAIKLIHIRLPEPSHHPDERMNWTLRDVEKLFPTGPSAKEQPRSGPTLIRSSS
jgi:hypothetical protein